MRVLSVLLALSAAGSALTSRNGEYSLLSRDEIALQGIYSSPLILRDTSGWRLRKRGSKGPGSRGNSLSPPKSRPQGLSSQLSGAESITSGGPPQRSVSGMSSVSGKSSRPPSGSFAGGRPRPQSSLDKVKASAHEGLSSQDSINKLVDPTWRPRSDHPQRYGPLPGSAGPAQHLGLGDIHPQQGDLPPPQQQQQRQQGGQEGQGKSSELKIHTNPTDQGTYRGQGKYSQPGVVHHQDSMDKMFRQV